MSKFVERTVCPGNDNKYYLRPSVGGLNECLEIQNGSVLPNCVGYTWGRAYELMGTRPNLARGNAENLYGYPDGYDRGDTPKLGAIICFRKGQAGNPNDGYGHVAVVEQINSDGSIVTSNSAYGGSKFYLRTLQAPYSFGEYIFQGFIYLPIEVEEEPSSAPTPTTNTYKYEIGTKVFVKGALYFTSYDEKSNGYCEGKETIITRRNDGAPHPYNTTGDLGWMDEDSIKLINTTNTNEPSYTTYTVQSGDTLSGIAKKYNTTWQKIYEDNRSVIGDNPNLILIGQKLVIK